MQMIVHITLVATPWLGVFYWYSLFNMTSILFNFLAALGLSPLQRGAKFNLTKIILEFKNCGYLFYFFIARGGHAVLM